jgi:hypothetical protein
LCPRRGSHVWMTHQMCFFLTLTHEFFSIYLLLPCSRMVSMVLWCSRKYYWMYSAWPGHGLWLHFPSLLNASPGNSVSLNKLFSACHFSIPVWVKLRMNC